MNPLTLKDIYAICIRNEEMLKKLLLRSAEAPLEISGKPEEITEKFRAITDNGELRTSDLLNQCKKLFPVYSYYGDEQLDEDFSVPKKSTTHYFRDVVEADEELANKSANDLKTSGIKGITLRERLIYELAYFTETGKHLDIANWTLCSGSRYPDGHVPRVGWCYGELDVGWYDPAHACGGLRARERFPM
ncbi:MAG: hypothetical protein Q8R36_03810 [bacterium]|nr:hypothetical protein [bacterium]